MKIENKVIATIRKYDLLNPGDKVICALSGGPDSVAMTSILNSLKEKLKISIVAAHLNHMLRGKESDEDEQFVKDFCKKLNVKIITEKLDIKKMSKGKNIEAVAREERYKFLEKVRLQENAQAIAVGHTSSDLVETIIFNLVKGSGIKGLRGFLPRRGKVIRPLFELERTEIENFLEERNIPYRLDSSNLCKNLSRNLIRIEVIPELKKINPNLERTLLSSSETLRELEDFVNSNVKEVLRKATLSQNSFSIGLDVTRKLHPFILKSMIQEAFFQLTGEILSSRKLKDVARIVEKAEFKAIDLKGGFVAYSDQKTLTIKKKGKVLSYYKKLKSLPEVIETPLGIFEFFQSDVKLEEEDTFCFPKDYLKKGIEVRNRREGDRIKLKSGTKSIKKLFIDRKIPKLERDVIPLVATTEGEVLWIPNVAKAYIINDSTGKFICVRFKSGT